MNKISFKIAASALAVAATMASTAHAAGFQLTEQSALALGRAYAGVGVDGTDFSGQYYNPATMTLHPGTGVQAGFVGVGLNLDYAGNNGSTENGRAHPEVVPHGYIQHQINDSLWAGLAITVPFGMATEFDKNWEHADHGTNAKIMVVDFNPNIAWKFNEKFSFGAGMSLQYVDAELGLGLNNDGKRLVRSELDASNYAWGWNVGMMFRPVDNVRIGLSYRAAVEHNARGTVKFSGSKVDALSGNSNNLSEQLIGNKLKGGVDSTTTVEAPAWALLSAAWDVNSDISLYASLRWADWSSFKSVDTITGLEKLLDKASQKDEASDDIKLVNQFAKKAGSIKNYWKDTWLTSVGGDWRVNDFWTLRGGIAYETSPIRKKELRTAIIPDADRWWFSVGSSFHWTKDFQTDVAFAHLHGVKERSLYNQINDHTYKEFGKFRKLDAYLIGVQAQYRF